MIPSDQQRAYEQYRIQNLTNNMNGGLPQPANSGMRISSGVENYPHFTVSSDTPKDIL